jgi:hypothetical protein
MMRELQVFYFGTEGKVSFLRKFFPEGYHRNNFAKRNVMDSSNDEEFKNSKAILLCRMAFVV